jgi:hypothetical protein
LSLLLLSRPECSLCDEFVEELEQAFPALAESLRVVDVDSRDDWRSLFGRRIPVLLGEDGRVWSEGVFDPDLVARCLAAAGNGEGD